MNKPIRVCFIIDSLSCGGTETQLLMLLKHLDRSRIEPYLVLLKKPGEEKKTDEPDCRVNCRSVNRLGVDRFFSCSIFAESLRFRRFLRENKIDLIQAYFPDSTLFASVVGTFSGVKAVFGAKRNIGHALTAKDRRIARFLNRFFIDKIVANAHACGKAAIEQECARPENVIVIPNGIETDRFGNIPTWTPENANAPRRIGAVGNLRPVKGADILIHAAKIVLEKHPEVRFEVAGQGDCDYYNRLIGKCGIADSFTLTGPRNDVPEFLATLDVAVLPSRAEGLSNALMEYMAAGRPCVATDVGGNGELIENRRNGLLVPPECPQALAEAIVELLRHPKKAGVFAETARNDIDETYDAPKIAGRFTELCEEVLAGTSEMRRRRPNRTFPEP